MQVVQSRRSIRLGFLFTATFWLACSQDPTTDSSSLMENSGGGGAGSSAGSAAMSGSGGAGRGGAGSSAAGMPARASAGGAGAAGAAPQAAAAGRAGSASGSGGAGAPAHAGGAGAAGAAGSSSAAYSPCPASGVCKILPLGDSITYGIGYNGGYRVELFHEAHADAKQITFTGSLSNGPNTVDGVSFPKNNEGHSGWKIDQLLPLIPMPALQDPPHIVLLMIGTNDIAQNDNLSDAPKRLGGLLDKLAMNAPDALIVVAKLTPLSRSTGVEAYNTAIAPVVQERAAAGKHVVLVDQSTGFPTSELGDGVHPNQQGYERMAGVWYQAISGFLH